MRKSKTLIQTVIAIVILLLAMPMPITYAKNIEENIITVEETKEEELLLTAGIADLLDKDIPYQENLKNKKVVEDNNLTNLGEYKLTAYCSCEKCCGKWSQFNRTASGTVPQQGRTVACNSLDFGTEIIINGEKYIVEDTGNMGNNIIDIYFNSHEAALIFGVQYAEVFKIS